MILPEVTPQHALEDASRVVPALASKPLSQMTQEQVVLANSITNSLTGGAKKALVNAKLAPLMLMLRLEIFSPLKLRITLLVKHHVLLILLIAMLFNMMVQLGVNYLKQLVRLLLRVPVLKVVQSNLRPALRQDLQELLQLMLEQTRLCAILNLIQLWLERMKTKLVMLKHSKMLPLSNSMLAWMLLTPRSGKPPLSYPETARVLVQLLLPPPTLHSRITSITNS